MHLVDLRVKLADQTKHLKYYIKPDSYGAIIYELLHTLVIIYSLFAIPVYVIIPFKLSLDLLLKVGFDIEMSLLHKVLEFIVFCEQILYIICSFRTAQYAYGILTLEKKVIIPKIQQKGIFWDFLGLIPLFILFSKNYYLLH